VQKAVEMASPLIEERGHRLSLDVPERGLLVDGDEGRVAQVISNPSRKNRSLPGGTPMRTAEATTSCVRS
jgi:hypothetical protein